MGAPWGWYQKIPYIKNKVREELGHLAEAGIFLKPIENPKTNGNEVLNETLSTETKEKEILPKEDETPTSEISALRVKQAEMEQRQIALEIFLKDYVLEVDYIRDK